jgi:hypothetical protein
MYFNVTWTGGDANPMPAHVNWLVNTGTTIQTADGLAAEVWELQPGNDQATLSAWAKHFREHYCEDAVLGSVDEVNSQII